MAARLRKRLASAAVEFIMSLSGLWKRCLGRTKCYEGVDHPGAAQREPDHTERDSTQPAILAEKPPAVGVASIPFVPDDDSQIYGPFFLQQRRTASYLPHLMESVVE